MKLARAFGIASFLALASLACSGLPTDMGGITLPSADLTEPWSGLDLPLDGGNVLHSDGTSLSVQFEGEKVDKVPPLSPA